MYTCSTDVQGASISSLHETTNCGHNVTIISQFLRTYSFPKLKCVMAIDTKTIVCVCIYTCMYIPTSESGQNKSTLELMP